MRTLIHWIVCLCCCSLLAASNQWARTVQALKVSVAIPDLVKLNDPFWLNCSQFGAPSSQLTSEQMGPKWDRATAKKVATGRSSLGRMDSLRNSSAELAELGDNLQELGARIDGKGSEIYAIKWYKDEEEFYRYLPNAEPKVSIYETNGIQLDQLKSHEGNVLVSKADVNSEGNYRCEIVSEAPDFETVRKGKHLKIYALPVRGPRIEILDSNGRPKSPKAQEISYAVGDKIELRCNAAPSKPAARLRWYLNEQELMLPQVASGQPNAANRSAGQLAVGAGGQPLAYHVRISPVEYRQHYKAIYSAHSTLSLLLQRDDLTSSRISFKCLASMRQDIVVPSKQLIVLTSASGSTSASGEARETGSSGLQRARRSRWGSPAGSSSSAHADEPRHRVQYSARHAGQQEERPSVGAQLVLPGGPKPLSQLGGELGPQFHYIFEDSHSTLGPSIIESPARLEEHLGSSPDSPQASHSSRAGGQPVDSGDQAAPLSWPDNLDLLQSLREARARQRMLPGSSRRAGLAGGQFQQQALRSPLYLDELDPLRPVLHWPPLQAGTLALVWPFSSIVAIPRVWPAQQAPSGGGAAKLLVPPKWAHQMQWQPHGAAYRTLWNNSHSQQDPMLLLERLVESLNCTCSEGNLDTKLAWLVNEAHLLGPQDTRFYASRLSPDHRQTWTTIGMQSAASQSHSQSQSQSPSKAKLLLNNNNQLAPMVTGNSASSLQTILEQYLRRSNKAKRQQLATSPGDSLRGSQPSHRLGGGGGDVAGSVGPNGALDQAEPGSQLENADEQHIKIMCQAQHSMLLYSSSEMITFDFNPPQTTGFPANGENTIDKLSSFANNVIQATQASQSRSSATSSIYVKYLFPKQRSHQYDLGFTMTGLVALGYALLTTFVFAKLTKLTHPPPSATRPHL